MRPPRGNFAIGATVKCGEAQKQQRGHSNGRDQHENAGQQAQRIEGVARKTGNDGERRIAAFDPTGDKHQHDVGKDAPVPYMEGPAAG